MLPDKKSELAKRDVLRMSNEESNKLTKECLQTALIYLMNEKPFEKITITELVARSGVSRSAFYRNYSSKEDIITEICNNVLSAVSESLSSIRDDDDLYSWFCKSFQKVKDNEKIFRLLLQADFPDKYLMNSTLSLEKVFPSPSPEEHYRTLARQGAFDTILVNWFQDGMKESIPFMAQFCVELFD